MKQAIATTGTAAGEKKETESKTSRTSHSLVSFRSRVSLRLSPEVMHMLHMGAALSGRSVGSHIEAALLKQAEHDRQIYQERERLRGMNVELMNPEFDAR